MNSESVPRPIARARQVAGAVLIVAMLIVVVAIIWGLNWYLNRPPAL